jgi:DNA-binding response OmpR family regulator
MSKKTILIIDDEEQFGKLLKLNLEATTEYAGLVATTGAEGLRLVREHAPDLVLLDIMMPDTDGMEVLKQIKAMSPQVPVAMVTGVWNEQEAKRAFAAGAFEYITKPVHLDYLKTALLVKLL